LLPTFHYRQTCPESLANFLFPVNFFCIFFSTLCGGVTCKFALSQRGISCVFLIRWCEMFLWITEYVCKHLRYCRSGTYFLRWSWKSACQFVGTQWKYFHVGEKVSSKKECIHDGRTWERKRNSLPHSGRRGTRWGSEMEGKCRQLLTLKTYFVTSHSKITHIWTDLLVGSKQLKKETVVVARKGLF